MGIHSVIIVGVCLVNTLQISRSTNKTCSRIERIVLNGKVRYYSRVFCCGNYEPNGTICKECKVGYTSLNGEQCKTCADGTYGKRCTELCFCSQYQRCDHVRGCVYDFLQTVSYDEQNLSTSETTSTTFERYNGLNASFSLSKIIYIVCIVCGILVLTLLITCIQFLRPSVSYPDMINQGRQLTADTTIQNIDNGLEQEYLEQTHEYEEIDETALTVDIVSNRTGPLNIEESSNNDLHSSNDGYLNPYQPIILYSSTHQYAQFLKVSEGMGTSKSLPTVVLRNTECIRLMRTKEHSVTTSVSYIDTCHGQANVSICKCEDRWSV